MTQKLEWRFAVGAEGLSHSGVWKVWVRKASIYCLAATFGGEIKSTIHPPSAHFPNGKRHWGFTDEAASEVAEAAKGEGGRHKIIWPGQPLGRGCALEWRITFRGSSSM